MNQTSGSPGSFVTGRPVPRLVAPDWVTQDLSSF